MGGNIIVVGENYLAGFSESFGARLHRHPLIEIYAACDGDGQNADDDLSEKPVGHRLRLYDRNRIGGAPGGLETIPNIV